MTRARLREIGLAAFFFLLATLVFLWPLPLHLSDGMVDLWDAKLNAWILHWDFHQTFRAPLRLFEANIFYPAKDTLAFSENLYGVAVFGFPLYAAGVSTLTAYNVLFLLGMFLSALSAWALARYVTGDALASILAGVVYAFLPWRIAHIPQIQFQWGAFLALLLLFLLRYLDGGRRRDLILFGLCFLWNGLTNVHYALFAGMLAFLVLAYEAVAGTEARRWARILSSLLSLTFAGLLLIPFFLPYRNVAKLYGMRRSFEEMEYYSGRLLDFLVAGSQNRLYGPLTKQWERPEANFFPGLIPLVLAVVALGALWSAGSSLKERSRPRQIWLLRLLDVSLLIVGALCVAAKSLPELVVGPLKLREPGRLVVWGTGLLLVRLTCAFPRWSRYRDLRDFLQRMPLPSRAALWLVIGMAGVLIALGAHTPYYRFVFQSFGFPFRAIRAPARGIVLFDLALAILAAWGLAVVAGGRSRSVRWSFCAAAIFATGLEYRAFPLEVRPVQPDPAPVYRWLAGIKLPGAVVEWPLALVSDVEAVFRSTVHWKPIVNGYSGFAPPHYEELSAILAEQPIRDVVWDKLRGLGASILIFHPRRTEGDAQLAYVQAVRKGIRSGKLKTLGCFPNGDSRDYVFRIMSSPLFDPAFPAADRRRAATEAEQELDGLEYVFHAPFGYIDWPEENATVTAGSWGFGWALDDSGIAQVLISGENGPAFPAVFGLARASVGAVYSGYPDVEKAGFGFGVPELPPGPHTLTVTIVAKDGGRTELKRKITVR